MHRHFIEKDDYILYDQGVGTGLKHGLWKCPRKLNKYMSADTRLKVSISNMQIRLARNPVEQTYKSMKTKWPIFKMWKKAHCKLFPTWCVCAALCNIDYATGYPIRASCTLSCRMCN